MVKDFKITGPELVSFEGAVAALELLPDPDSASPWANTDMKVTDADSKTLEIHLGRSRLLARGSKGITIEVQMGELLRMLFRAPDSEGEDGRVEFATEDFNTHPIGEVLAVSDFLTQLRRVSTVDFRVNGSRLMRIVLNGVTEADWPDYFQETRAIADDLAVIERETKTRFRYPATLTALDRVNIRNARLMLEGHVVAHPTDNQFGARINGELDSALEVLLNGQPGWMKWEASPAHLTVLDEVIEVPELAVGGPTRLSDEDIAGIRRAIAEGVTDGLPLRFKLDDPGTGCGYGCQTDLPVRLSGSRLGTSRASSSQPEPCQRSRASDSSGWRSG
jgi:hypothetical protein